MIVERYIVPLANIGRMSGDPHDQVNRLSLNTESNSTGFSFQPDSRKPVTYRQIQMVTLNYIIVCKNFSDNPLKDFEMMWDQISGTDVTLMIMLHNCKKMSLSIL